MPAMGAVWWFAGVLPMGDSTAWNAVWQLANALAERDDRSGAEAAYRELLAWPDADGPSALMRDAIRLALAEVLAEQGRLAEARTLLTQAEAADRDNRRRFRHHAKHYAERLRDARQALARGGQWVREDPQSPWGWRELLQGWQNLGQGAQSLDLLTEVLERPATDDDAAQLARAAEESGEWLLATQLYAQAVTRFPHSSALRQDWLDHLAAHAEPAVAIAAWRAQVREAPDHHGLRLGLYRLLKRDGQHDAAISQLEALLAEAPDQPGLLLELGVLQAATGQSEAAEATFLAHIRRWPDSGPSDPRRHVQFDDAYTRLVAMLADLGQLDRLPELQAEQGWSTLQRAHLARALERRARLATTVPAASRRR
jgi:tetratricopeptide (TPR) repeat protein